MAMEFIQLEKLPIILDSPYYEDIATHLNKLSVLTSKKLIGTISKLSNGNSFELAKSLITIFVHSNWLKQDETNPRGIINKTKKLPILNSVRTLEKQEGFHSLINKNNEVFSQPFLDPSLLQISSIIFNFVKDDGEFKIKGSWWLMRCLAIHQSLLEHYSADLDQRMRELADFLSKSALKMDGNKDEKIPLLIEILTVSRRFKMGEVAKDVEQTLFDRTGVKFIFEGALGKTTKYQTVSHPQMVVKIDRKFPSEIEENDSNEGENNSSEIKNIPLDDDTLLETPCLDSKNGKTQLSAVETKLLFGESLKQKARNLECFTCEFQISLEELISQKNCSCSMRYTALYQRSKIEMKEMRRSQRSLHQLEELRSFNGPNLLNDFWVCAGYIPPKKTLLLELAKFYLQQGHFSDALEIFKEFDHWEPIVKCLINCGRVSNALEKIECEFQKGSNDHRLFLYKGKISGDGENYEKAWELSGGKCSEAKRLLGDESMRKKEWETAIGHFQKALSVNYLFAETWRKLSHCYQKLSMHEDALRSLARSVGIDCESYEAWNDFGVLHLKLRNFDAAELAFRRSLESNGKNWKVWDNLLTVSTALKNWFGVVNCMINILEIDASKFELQSELFFLLIENFISVDIPVIHKKRLDCLIDKLVSLKGGQMNADVYGAMAKYFDKSFEGESGEDKSKRIAKAEEFKKKQNRALRKNAYY